MAKKQQVESVEALAQKLTRDEVRARLQQAGILVRDVDGMDVEPVSDEELERTGDLPLGAQPSEELVRQDRG